MFGTFEAVDEARYNSVDSNNDNGCDDKILEGPLGGEAKVEN